MEGVIGSGRLGCHLSLQGRSFVSEPYVRRNRNLADRTRANDKRILRAALYLLSSLMEIGSQTLPLTTH